MASVGMEPSFIGVLLTRHSSLAVILFAGLIQVDGDAQLGKSTRAVAMSCVRESVVGRKVGRFFC